MNPGRPSVRICFIRFSPFIGLDGLVLHDAHVPPIPWKRAARRSLAANNVPELPKGDARTNKTRYGNVLCPVAMFLARPEQGTRGVQFLNTGVTLCNTTCVTWAKHSPPIAQHETRRTSGAKDRSH